ENRLRRIGNRSRADLFELGNYRAGVVVRHDMTRTNRNEIAGMNCRAGRKSIRVTRGNLFDERKTHIRQSTINPQLSTVRASLLGGALAKKLGDVEVHEVGVMENDRLDRAFHLIALVTVGGDDVHDFARNAVLEGERDAAKWMPHLLPKFSLNHFA